MENFISLLPFIILILAFLSLWIRRDPKIWGSLLGLSFAAAYAQGYVDAIAILIVLGWAGLWILYARSESTYTKMALFAAFIILSFAFKFDLFPGFHSLHFTDRYNLGFNAPIVGFFPLALLVPLSRTKREWKDVFLKGSWLIVVGIGLMAIAALSAGAVKWDVKIPSFPVERYLSNLLLTAVAEEGFYRGFLQRELCGFFPKGKWGKCLALILSSLIFTLAHIFWSPGFEILGFVFIAGLLYGGVYLLSGRIESAILCHFLLNFIHMTFFTYFAM